MKNSCLYVVLLFLWSSPYWILAWLYYTVISSEICSEIESVSEILLIVNDNNFQNRLNDHVLATGGFVQIE